MARQPRTALPPPLSRSRPYLSMIFVVLSPCTLARSFQNQGGYARCTAAERLYSSSPPAPAQYDTWYFVCGDHLRVSTEDVCGGGDIHNRPCKAQSPPPSTHRCKKAPFPLPPQPSSSQTDLKHEDRNNNIPEKERFAPSKEGFARAETCWGYVHSLAPRKGPLKA